MMIEASRTAGDGRGGQVYTRCWIAWWEMAHSYFITHDWSPEGCAAEGW